MAKKNQTPLKAETRKIFGLFAIIFLAVMLLGGAIFYFAESRFMNKKFVDDGNISLVFVELLGIEDIIVEDEETLSELLKKIASSNESIQSIIIENEAGHELATWTHPHPSPMETHTRYDKDVFISGEKFGRVIVEFDFYATSLSVKHHIQLLSVIFSVISLIAALFFYYFTRKLLIKPMRALYHFMDKRVQGGDAILAAPSSSFYTLFELAARLSDGPRSSEVVSSAAPESPTEVVSQPVSNSEISPVVEGVPTEDSPVNEAPESPAPSSVTGSEVAPAVEESSTDIAAPVPQTESSAAIEAPATVESAEPAPISKETVLVVDDEEMARNRIQKALGESYECLFAEECDAGLELFKQNKDKINLAILPLVILEMMGDTDRIFEAFRAEKPDLNIIFTTATFATMPIPAKLAAAPRVVFIEKGTESEAIPEKILLLAAA